MSTDIVVARYNESLDWLHDYPLNHVDNLYIYNKGDPLSFSHYNDNVNTHIIPLPNVGREFHTYLYHIINHFDKLPTMTIFFPGSPFHHSKFDRIKALIEHSEIDNSQSFIVNPIYVENIELAQYHFTLDNWESSCPENTIKNPITKLYPCHIRPFGKWYQHHFPNCIQKFAALNGLFAAHKDDLLSNPLHKYNELLTELSYHHTPEVGHYLERAFLSLIQPKDPSKDIKVVTFNPQR